MGLFDIFKKKTEDKPKYKGTIEQLLMGYMLTETSKLLGEPVHSDKFNELQKSASKVIEQTVLPGLNKKIMQEVFNTFSLHCPKNSQGAFGQYLILLFVRFGHIQHAIVDGKVRAEEATLDILAEALHHQLKSFISSVR